MFEKISVPTPSTAISWLALIVALGGTAVAAGTTIVSIADRSGARVANVDGLSRLRVAASPAAPSSGFSTLQYVWSTSFPGTMMLGPSTATVVLTSLTLGNYYDQYNRAMVRVVLYLGTSSNAGCTSGVNYRLVGAYYAAAGQSNSISFPAGMVLKPASPGNYWCLTAAAVIQGGLSTYYVPELTFTGYVESGSFITPAATAAEATAMPQLVRR